MVPGLQGEWHQLWAEYEQASTEEAKAVKQLDKFDMVAQALTYEEKYGLDLSEFFDSTADVFKQEPFVSWDRQVRARRAELKQSR